MACLLLDVDPVGLVRGKGNWKEWDLFRVAWSPNGKHIAVLAKDGTLWTLGTPAADRPIYHPDFLEDGILQSVKGVDTVSSRN